MAKGWWVVPVTQCKFLTLRFTQCIYFTLQSIHTVSVFCYFTYFFYCLFCSSFVFGSSCIVVVGGAYSCISSTCVFLCDRSVCLLSAQDKKKGARQLTATLHLYTYLYILLLFCFFYFPRLAVLQYQYKEQRYHTHPIDTIDK